MSEGGGVYADGECEDMTRRERVEQVLQIYLTHGMMKGHWEACVNDLTTLQPEPDREELEKILNSVGLTPILWSEHPEQMRTLADHLLAWARGEMTRGWCPHIYQRYSKTKFAFRWFLRNPQVGISAEQGVGDDWSHCPIQGCGAKRPT